MINLKIRDAPREHSAWFRRLNRSIVQLRDEDKLPEPDRNLRYTWDMRPNPNQPISSYSNIYDSTLVHLYKEAMIKSEIEGTNLPDASNEEESNRIKEAIGIKTKGVPQGLQLHVDYPH